ncbi:MAG TPA: N-acetylmuramoyl-L-alanine amidase, partial [Dehalococcoidia bacterium]|nr:N-acetylmuramoyl-L-alanine amidase [Dehalococcoidia bacterium]
MTWSPWEEVRPDCLTTSQPGGERFGSLIHAPDGQFLQYRVTFRMARGASPRLHRVTNTVIDAPVIATGVTTKQVDGAVSYPTLEVIPRESWGADEKYRFDKRGKEIWPEMFVPAKKLIIHHTATRNSFMTPADAAAEVRAIYHYHAVTQHWGDIGYNLLIDKFGNIYEGRHGRGEGSVRETLSADVVAGHDYNHNYGSVGIVLVGNSTRADWTMGSADDDDNPMWQALKAAAAFEAGRHGIRPLLATKPAVSDFLRSDDLWSDGMKNVSGHRETNSTTCPGEIVMGLLDPLRSDIDDSLKGTTRIDVYVNEETRSHRET